MDKRLQALLNSPMLGLGFWEVVIIGLIALVVIGPERLPDFAKSVAKFLNEMKRTASDLKTAFDDEKDIFKENIDQIQKLKSELHALPNSLKKDTQKTPQPYEAEPALDSNIETDIETELNSVYEDPIPVEQPLDLDPNVSLDNEPIHQKDHESSQKGKG